MGALLQKLQLFTSLYLLDLQGYGVQTSQLDKSNKTIYKTLNCWSIQWLSYAKWRRHQQDGTGCLPELNFMSKSSAPKGEQSIWHWMKQGKNKTSVSTLLLVSVRTPEGNMILQKVWIIYFFIHFYLLKLSWTHPDSTFSLQAFKLSRSF